MNPDQKKQLVLDAMRAFLSSDSEASAKYLADDASWWMAKSLSGELPKLTSKEQIIQRNAGVKTMFPEGLKTQFHHVYCDGDTVIVEFNNRGKAANGKLYDQDYCAVFVLDGDKIKEIREHQDSLHVHRTFHA